MIAIGVEPFSQALYDEVLPLARKCWQESTEQKLQTCAFYGDRDFDVEPEYSEYQRLHDLGALVFITLRDEKLVGYIVGILYKSHHHKGIQCAGGDSIYIESDYRSYTPVMVSRFEKELTERGVKIIGWPTTQGSAVYELLKSMGFVGDDIVMEKRLCV